MKILIWKDSKVSFRSLGFLIIFVALVGYLPILLILWEQIKVLNDSTMLGVYLRSCISFLPAMQIPMIGTLVFQVTLNEDRKTKALQVLVADGILPEHIWLAKLAASVTIAYVFSFLSLFLSIILSRILFQVWIPFDTISLLSVALIIPVVSFSFLSIIGTIMWISRQGQALAGLLPVFSYLGCMYFNIYLMDNNSWPKIGLLLLLFLISALVFLINIVVIKKINNEYIVNMQI